MQNIDKKVFMADQPSAIPNKKKFYNAWVNLTSSLFYFVVHVKL